MSTHKSIPKAKRIEVWNMYDHHCAYCGCELKLKEMQVDHIDSIYTHCDYKKEKMSEINKLDNLMSACKRCNFY